MPPHDNAAAAVSIASARRNRVDDEALVAALEHVRDALRGLAYGTITIAVQDGVIVQIDRNEKVRLDRSRGR